MESCLYVGQVRHVRRRPVEHEFRKGLCMAWLDLDELPRVFRGRWLWSVERRTPVSFRRGDHFGDPDLPLSDAVRREVERRSGVRPSGPIRLLTQLRWLGLSFNPVSFYYCYDAHERLEAILADVTNTPWRERHAYVLPVAAGRRTGRCVRFETPKEFHVSPFMAMDLDYGWWFDLPGERLRLGIANSDAGGRLFEASLELRRREISTANLARALLRYPWMSAQVVAGIYWQALRLHWKRAPFFPHPGNAGAPDAGWGRLHG